MKKLLPILFVLIITSCSPPPEVDWYQLVEREGVYYEVNSQIPFTGSSISYDGNGQLSTKTNYTDGELDGLYEFYSENGLMEQHNYKDGKLDGPSIMFYENGSILSKYIFKEGKLHGTVEYFDYEGELLKSQTYRNDLLHGPTKTSFQTLNHDDQGEWYSVINYKDGEPHGLVESTHSISYKRLKNRMYFKEGKLHGTFEFFDEDGQLIQRTCYQDSETVDMSYCD